MDDNARVQRKPHVVVVGAGFGGLQCAKALRGEPVDVTIVDPRDYHLFTPLLYQVASCVLNPSEVAAPIRKVFRGVPNIRYRQDEVVALDHDRRSATLASGSVLEFDACVIATGSATNYYGNATATTC
jgi:NADH dehydrogenase